MEKDDVGIELSFQYNDGYNENVFSFVNNINTHEGGTHLTGFSSRRLTCGHDQRLRRQVRERGSAKDSRTSRSPVKTYAKASRRRCST